MDSSKQEKQTDQLVRKTLSEILADNEILHSNDHIQMIINATNILYDRGWTYGYDDIAKLLTTEKSKQVIVEKGLERAIQAVTLMKLPPRRSLKKISRNALCYCDSGKKYKHCCITKHT